MEPDVLSSSIQRIMGDGHDLSSPRFAGDEKLEGCYDDETRLNNGDKGESVRKVQQALIELGYDLGPRGSDAVYGQRTSNAVKAFKRDERLGFEQVGDVGPGTMTRLNSIFGAPIEPSVPPEEPVIVGEVAACGGDGGVSAAPVQAGAPPPIDPKSLQRQQPNPPASPPAGNTPPCPIPTSFSQFTGTPPAAAGDIAAQNKSEIVKVNNDHLAGAFISSEAWLNPKKYQHPASPQPIPWVEQVTNQCKTTWTFPNGPRLVTPNSVTQCPASATNIPPRNVGPQDCDSQLRLRLYAELAHDRDSRLLRHEQFHTKLTCVIADIANDVIADEVAKGATKQDALDGVWIGVQPAKNRLQQQYDHDSGNGCNMAGQTQWETQINQGKTGPLKTQVTGGP